MIEWLKMMDEPERSEVLKWTKDHRIVMNPGVKVKNIHSAIIEARRWGLIVHNSWLDIFNNSYWLEIFDKYKKTNR